MVRVSKYGFDEELQHVYDEVSRYSREQLHPLNERMDKDDWFPEEALDKVGLLGTTVPEEYGGQGLDFLGSELVTILGLPADDLNVMAEHEVSENWDPVRRRPDGSSMPPTLWELMVPSTEAAKLARRPLEISIDDNINFFDSQQDESDPVFEASR